MNDTYEEDARHERGRGGKPGVVMGAFDALFDSINGSLRTIARDKALFLGVALTLIGLLSFKSDKFCDGNTADYLSCTRPSTFYFYSPLEISIIVVGVFLILIWMLNRRGHRS